MSGGALHNRVWLGAFAALFALACLGGAAAQEHPEPRLADPGEIRDTIDTLERSLTGKLLVQKAAREWAHEWGEAGLSEFVRWGDTSRTDAVLTRFLNPRTGEERRERRVTIYLKRGQSPEDRVLDLAHELVHATSRPSWDPYDPALHAAGYISAAIEGPGGEVEAVIAECEVGLELGLSSFPSAARCRGYLEPGQTRLSRDRVTADFYRSGQWSGLLREKLGARARELPLLSPETPALYSSTGKLPYPIALYNEFEALNEVACRNSIGRLQSSSAPIRSRASEFVQSRCRKR